MNIETKKNSIIQMILSIADEDILDQISKKLVRLMPANQGNIVKDNILDKYRSVIEADFDLDKIKKEQNYQGIDSKKMDRLIEEADIQEPIEDLLKMI